MTNHETVIGLECHVELATATKMFCGCPNEFGSEPNTNVCPVCLGHPGTLPVPNRKAIEYTIKIGLALGCEIAPHSLFHRKNYFYPDMPKNFQISQYDLPLCVNGHMDLQVDGQNRPIGIARVHLEEDTGKTTHGGETGRIAGADYALEDYNRAGVPLVEVVSDPDVRSAEEAREYLTELRATLEALGVSDVRMEEGSLRCDANVSVRPIGSQELGVKVEIKNLNSIRSLYRAIRFEERRQRETLDAGGTIVQETRHWDEDAGRTSTLRSKEYAFDYRYFPEPDLAPIEPDAEWVEKLRTELPELPAVRRRRFIDSYGLSPSDAGALTADRRLADAFEELFERHRAVGGGSLASWVLQHRERLDARLLGDVIALVVEGTVSALRGKDVYDIALRTGQDVERIIDENGWRQVSDAGALDPVIEEVLSENPGPVEQFRKGKEGVLGFLVGQVMRKTSGSADPKRAGELLRERLSSQEA